ncbi:hypothetical protein DYBT9275_00418 [Dyadobacter sp. CECT 9275]|uniref:DUF3052 domain-containing protein n=1 Tax=Dyadobacter helix TaxID=2822344 RepID=A0A916J8B7_9BACT|nr:hypothetical protein [Dyadobacter sp. CECT 9275]CAG4989968.1 hypothetical protein DYBT9275_00418 [Dyadobacter sp. CECT 9275]
MDTVFKKLNLKDQKEVVVLNSPASFEENIACIRPEATIIRSAEGITSIGFILVFVTRQTEIDTIIPQLGPLLKADAVIWMCYPKGTSKKYKADFNRDNGWAVMGSFDLEPVRMVAIDEDWSALRFKKVDLIKTMTRSSLHALSEKGKAKAGQKD